MDKLRIKKIAARIAVTLVKGFEEELDPNIVLLEPAPKALPISDPLPAVIVLLI